MVFGSVVDGMSVVRRIESTGSKSGKTSERIVIADCGVLASKAELVRRMKEEQERQERERLNPLDAPDADQESLRRLRELQQGASKVRPPRGPCRLQCSADDARLLPVCNAPLTMPASSPSAMLR